MSPGFVENLFRSLEREMNAQFEKVNERFGRLEARIDHMLVRMDRQGTAINAGARWVTRMIEWTEKHDVISADLLRRLERAEERLDKLEGKKPQ